MANQVVMPSTGTGTANSPQPVSQPQNSNPPEGARYALTSLLIPAGTVALTLPVNVAQFGMSQVASILADNQANAISIQVQAGNQSTAFGVSANSSQMMPVYSTGTNCNIIVTLPTAQDTDTLIGFQLFNTQQPPGVWQAQTNAVITNPVLNSRGINTGQVAIPSPRVQGANQVGAASFNPLSAITWTQLLVPNNDRSGAQFLCTLGAVQLAFTNTILTIAASGASFITDALTVGQEANAVIGNQVWKGSIWALATAVPATLVVQEYGNFAYNMTAINATFDQVNYVYSFGNPLAFLSKSFTGCAYIPFSPATSSPTANSSPWNSEHNTVECWIKISGVTGTKRVLMANGLKMFGGSTWSGVRVSVDANTSVLLLEFIDPFGNITPLSGSSVVCDGAWHHMAFVQTEAGTNIFLNGSLEIQTPIDLPMSSLCSFYLGADFGSLPSIGQQSVILPAGSSPWTVDPSWNPANNLILLQGPGGTTIRSSTTCAGANGGAAVTAVNQALSGTVAYQIGVTGGTNGSGTSPTANTWFKDATMVAAGGESINNTNVPATNNTAANSATPNGNIFAGGNGGAGVVGTRGGGGGGGAGSTGAGQAASSGSPETGGNGGVGDGGAPGGAGGTQGNPGNPGAPGASNSGGGGGGGGGASLGGAGGNPGGGAAGTVTLTTTVNGGAGSIFLTWLPAATIINPWGANIDELVIWNYPRYLEPFDIPIGQATGLEPGLIAVYHFNGNGGSLLDTGPGQPS